MLVWKVTQTYDDKGKVRVSVGSFEAESLPKSVFKHTKKCDYYEDYFTSYLQAKAFMDESEKA